MSYEDDWLVLSFKNAAAMSAMLTVLVGGLVLLQPVPLPKAPPKPIQIISEAVAETVMPKADREVRVIPITSPPKLVVTERIRIPDPEVPVDVPLAVSPPPVEDKPVMRRRHVALKQDVCARHGQRKVMVGRYKWRCRR